MAEVTDNADLRVAIERMFDGTPLDEFVTFDEMLETFDITREELAAMPDEAGESADG